MCHHTNSAAKIRILLRTAKEIGGKFAKRRKFPAFWSKTNSATDALSHRPSNLCTWCNGTPVLLLFSILYFFYLSFCRHYCYNYLIHSSLRSDDKRYRVDTLCILLTTSGRERKISRRKRNLLRRKKIFSRRESDGRSCRHPAFCRHVITCSVSV